MEPLRRKHVLALDEPREGRFVDAEFGGERALSERLEGGRAVTEEPFLVTDERLAEGEKRATTEREAVQEPARFVPAAPPVGGALVVCATAREATETQPRNPPFGKADPPAVSLGLDQEIREEAEGGESPVAGPGRRIEEAEKTPPARHLARRAAEAGREDLVASAGEVRERQGEKIEEKRASGGVEIVAAARLGAETVSEIERETADGIEPLEPVTDGLELLGFRRRLARESRPQFFGRFAEIAPLVEAIEEVGGERTVALAHAQTLDLLGQVGVERERRGFGLGPRAGVFVGAAGKVFVLERLVALVGGVRTVLRARVVPVSSLGLRLEEGVVRQRGLDRFAEFVAVEDEERKPLTETGRESQARTRGEAGAEAGHRTAP